jgi:hypothetical protein
MELGRFVQQLELPKEFFESYDQENFQRSLSQAPDPLPFDVSRKVVFMLLFCRWISKYAKHVRPYVAIDWDESFHDIEMDFQGLAISVSAADGEITFTSLVSQSIQFKWEDGWNAFIYCAKAALRLPEAGPMNVPTLKSVSVFRFRLLQNYVTINMMLAVIWRNSSTSIRWMNLKRRL